MNSKPTTRAWLAIVMAIVMAAMMAGCGFQLRGSADLPPQMARTYIQIADPTSPFLRALERQLEANRVELVSTPDAAGAILDIQYARMNRHALTISGAAQVREYQLRFEVGYQVLDLDGEVLVEADQVQLSRDYSFDEQEILAATREEEFLRDTLYRETAAYLVRRLEATTR